MGKGKLITNGVHLEDHELKTVKFFLDQDKEIELIPKSTIKDFHLGDFVMDGVVWEAKAPIGDGHKNAENTINDAIQQSTSIIIDLFRSRMNDDDAVKAYERVFKVNKSIKRLKIIKKNKEVIDFRK